MNILTKEVAIEILIEELQKITDISEKLFEAIFSTGKLERFTNLQDISYSHSERFLFIISGIAQVVYRSEHEEATIRFLHSKSFVSNKVISTPNYYIQSIGTVEVFSIPTLNLECLALEDRATRLFLTALIKKELNEINLSNAVIRIPIEKRLDYFRKTHSMLAEVVPFKWIASYLGVSCSTLKKLRDNFK